MAALFTVKIRIGDTDASVGGRYGRIPQTDTDGFDGGSGSRFLEMRVKDVI
jgi:hypothetical protein